MAQKQQASEFDRTLFGERMMGSGLLTSRQCEKVVKIQTQLKLGGKWKRFGAIAVEQGFCSANDVETMPGFLGQKMIDAGLLTADQQKELVRWQNRLRETGYSVRLGDLSISEGFCSKDQIENLFDDNA